MAAGSGPIPLRFSFLEGAPRFTQHETLWLSAHTSLLVVFWTLLIVFSFWFGLTAVYQKPDETAHRLAGLILAKDYASFPLSRKTPSASAHLPFDHGRGILARIVGRGSPGMSASDAWAHRALALMERGFIREVAEVAALSGRPYLRVLRPLPGGSSCASCHGSEVAPAPALVEVAVPMEPLWEGARRQVRRLFWLHAGLWCLGISAFLLVGRAMRRRVIERLKDEAALRELGGDLEYRVAARTAEVVLRRRELQAFMDNIDAGAFVKNPGHEFLQVNKYVADILREPEEALAGKTFRDILPLDMAAFLEEQETEVMENRKSRELDVGCLDRADPERRFSLQLFPIIGQDGEMQGVGGVLVDASRRKRMEAGLLEAKEVAEKASRSKSDFLANISHEIRTPLNGVIGMADLLLRSNLTPEQASMAATLKAGGDGLLTLLNDVLDFSKIEAGKITLENVPFSLRNTIFEAVKGLAPIAGKKGVELLIHVLPDVPEHLMGDPARIRQIVLNLVGNAIKFTNAGEVTVRVESLSRGDAGVSLRIAVSDTGVGIPEHICRTIFGAFEQADASTSRQYGGTGLGLAISSRLAALMGSRLEVRSVHGRGSTFFMDLTLPFSADAPPPRQSASIQALRDKRVLIVDDNTTSGTILFEQTRAWGLRPRSAPDVTTAMRMLRTAAEAGAPFEIVLSELQMPDKGGLALIEEMSANRLLDATPVLMLSSGSRPLDVRCRGIFRACLTKPVRPEELLESMASALNARESMAPPVNRLGAEGTGSGQAGLRVLLAEDMEINQIVAFRLLRELGHSVRVVENGRLAVRALEEEEFDLVLMDIQMPVLDGVQAVTKIRAYEERARPAKRVPIIAMTAHALKGDKERYLACGMDGYVSKPVVQESLARAILEVCRDRAL